MKIAQVLFSPFQRIAGGPALGLGMAAITIAALIGAPQHLHFDGVLDAHVGALAPWWIFLAEGLINWISLALPLLLAGRLLSKTAFRSLDLLGTQALARLPSVIIALACLVPGFRRYTDELIRSMTTIKPGEIPAMPALGMDTVAFFVVSLVMLVCVVWMVALMWKSFSHCCNVRGAKPVIAFVVALLVGELVSKMLISLVFKAV